MWLSSHTAISKASRRCFCFIRCCCQSISASWHYCAVPTHGEFMALPLLMLIPWNSPAPEPPAPNPWAPDSTSSSNMWDVADVMLDGNITEIVNHAFGTDLSLMDLIKFLYRFQTGQLTDAQMVQVIQMGSYFARNTLKWTLAADNLDHWLKAGSLPDPSVFMDHTLIKDQDPVVGTLCDRHYDAIVSGIKNR